MAIQTPSRVVTPEIMVLVATTRRAMPLARCVPDERRRDLPQQGRVEYNLFRSPASGSCPPFIALEEADQEWLDSMRAEGWPSLPPDFFKRHFVDSGDDAARPEVPLRYGAHPAPPESAMRVKAAA